MAIQAVSKMAGCSETAAKSQFFFIDKDACFHIFTSFGLVTTDRNNLDPAAAPFAKNPRDLEGLTEGASIIEVVKKVRPHVLLRLSGVGGIFNELTAIDAFKHAGGDIVFGSGSPFENVDLGNGKVGHVNQANNMYLFLGIGLGSFLSGPRLITDGMLQATAEWYAHVDVDYFY
ncbi:NAD-dependent malic enzyme 2, mitochondrial-like [Arachis stenosperma]|uniref:NAD-dependent malic enzyme 2, mitochondrial-like n=1 Tax=Arachis stenosperma TaxID=217475 RepID=UPI0025AD848F|nr:NAD-dependent malic enzyme 2, mitochondrial-like [Arachis stenosperma]